MLLISHRGNYCGRSPRENDPEQILEAMGLGYDVEIDVWYIDGHYYLGHDLPEYRGEVILNDLYRDMLWCHAKDGPTLRQLMKDGFNCFYNVSDPYVLTSKGFIWHFNGMKSVFVLDKEGKLVGYCSDDLRPFKK